MKTTRRLLVSIVFGVVSLAATSAVALPVSGIRGSDLSAGEHAGGRSFVLAFSGDTLIHPAVAASAARNGVGGAYDFGPMFDLVAPVLHASDLAICHLEVPLDPESRISGFPVFSAPAELAPALAQAGYDGCSTASNHSLDRGAQGIFDTLDLLEAAGLGATGTARGPDEAGGILYDLRGLVVGHLSYAYGVQHWSRAGDRLWIANRIDASEIVAAAGALKDRGADFVVVSLHWGTEFQTSANGEQRRLADELLSRSEIDLIVGTHPHVLQQVGFVSGKPVLYSLGNLLSNQTAPCCPPESEEGAIVLVEVSHEEGGWKVRRIEHVPTWVNRRSGHVITPALGEAAAASPNRSRLARAAARGSATLGEAGSGMSPESAYEWVTGLVPSVVSPLQTPPAGEIR